MPQPTPRRLGARSEGCWSGRDRQEAQDTERGRQLRHRPQGSYARRQRQRRWWAAEGDRSRGGSGEGLLIFRCGALSRRSLLERGEEGAERGCARLVLAQHDAALVDERRREVEGHQASRAGVALHREPRGQ